MTVQLTEERKQKIRKACFDILAMKRPTIRKVAEVIGMLVAAEPGCDFAPVFYKRAEIFKSHVLKIHAGNFDSTCTLSAEARQDFEWWSKNVDTQRRHLQRADVEIYITSDSSNYAWGARVMA